MSKGRLEEIEVRLKYGLGCLKNLRRKILKSDDESLKDQIRLLENDIKFLFEQAERVQELKSENNALKTVAMSNKFIGEHYRRQNKRYREALEFYADKKNYKPFDGIFLSSYQNKVDEDGGEIARKALKGE